jgi:hypothetical protein
MSKRFLISEEEKHRIKSLYEQTTGTTQPVDLNYILAQSESGKTNNDFCKSKTESNIEYDICLVVKSIDREKRDKDDNDKSRFLQSQGYVMIEKSALTQDSDGNYKKSSIWKKQ